MDWDLATFPEPAGKSIVFNQLLDNLRSVHEEACARNSLLERELTRHGIQGTGFTYGTNKDDPWMPSNFVAPREGPPPRRPPLGPWTLKTNTPSTCTPRSQASDILARQQEYLTQSIDNLTEQQGQLSEQIAGYLGEQIANIAEQQDHLGEQITKILTTVTMPKPVKPNGLVKTLKVSGVQFPDSRAKPKLVLFPDAPGTSEKTKGVLFPDETRMSQVSDRNDTHRASDVSDASALCHQDSLADSADRGSVSHGLGGVASHGFAALAGVARRSKKSIARATMKFAMRTSDRGKAKRKSRWVIKEDEGSEFRRMLQKILSSSAFNALSGTIIFSYAVMIAIETNMMAQDPDFQSSALQTAHYVFTGLFSAELLFRFAADRCQAFCGDDAVWNRLDAFFILSGATELIMEAATDTEQGGSAGSIARAVRIFRVFRTVRLIRSLRSMYEFQKMAYALLSSFKTLLCSLALLCFVMFFFAVWFTQYAADLQMRAEIQDLELRYGDLMSTSYTLFMSISGGISWDACYMPLFYLNVWVASGFVLYISLVYFGVLNVVTSVFVESVIRSVQHYKDIIVRDKEEEKKIAMSHVKELFKQVDGDGSGHISLDEMEEIFTEASLSQYMEALDIEVEDTRLLFRLLDCDNSGCVNVEEFCEGCLRLKGGAKSIDLASLSFQLKNFFQKWGEFTGYVEENFAEIRHKVEKYKPSMLR